VPQIVYKLKKLSRITKIRLVVQGHLHALLVCFMVLWVRKFLLLSAHIVVKLIH
jgi:hypothetical protein